MAHEQAGQVEARARAELLLRDVRVDRAEFRCQAGRVTVSLRAAERSIVETADLDGGDVRDRLIEVFGIALNRLAPADANLEPVARSHPDAPGTQSPTAPAPSGELVVGTTAPPLPPAAPPPSSATPASVPARAQPVRRSEESHPAPSRRTVEAAGGAALEWWRSTAAVGAAIETTYGDPFLRFGLKLGALAAVPPAEAFQAVEWNAALGGTWQPAQLQGVRLQAAIGASLLSVGPQHPYRPEGATSTSAGFGLLELSRPLWFGRWALIPELGVRVFAAERRVTLDDDAQLVLGPFVPRVTATLARSLD